MRKLVVKADNPLVNQAIIDRINKANDIHVVALMRLYDQARVAKDEAEDQMKSLKEQLSLGLACIGDLVEIPSDNYSVDICYPSEADPQVIEKWRLALQTNHYNRLNTAKLLAQGITPQQIADATDHSFTQFTVVKRLP